MIGFILNLLSDGVFLKKKLSKNPEDVLAEKIIKITAKKFGVALKALVGKSRDYQIVHQRFISIYLIKKYTELSLNQIAEHFGNRNHATIIHACREVEKKLASSDEKFISMFELIEEELIKIEFKQQK
jgi:chromosomal replication initiator protein